MSISSIGTTFQQTLIDSEPSSSRSVVKKELGKEDFLTLLVTQLKNQDPLKPMESTDFTAQLAQFSSLEQLFGVNDTLGNIQNSLLAQDDGDLLGYIGKMVQTNDNIISLKDGKANPGGYKLGSSASEITISIYNEYGTKVRTIREEDKTAGEYTLDWDGRNDKGDALEDGVYTFEITAAGENNESVLQQVYSKGEVTGVTYEGLVPYLIVGNRQIMPENIITVSKLNEP